jgi:hypothetical protein
MPPKIKKKERPMWTEKGLFVRGQIIYSIPSVTKAAKGKAISEF